MDSLNDIRRLFLSYFEAHDHRIISSAPLVPDNDPSLLFTNAGMAPFKDIFTARRQAPAPRAASAQKCIRAGGKHNDLDNVGYTSRHHTFFEMLGNFSFGDYFKEEAIHYAWEFITRDLALAPEKLLITVFDQDDEAFDLWKKTSGFDEKRIIRIDGADNFWSMGSVGPCGPCSEVFYDHGSEVSGGPPGSADEDGDRFVEIWNLVFMQFERSADGSQKNLPRPSIDTGMGLERIAAVMQGVASNYETDLFKNLIQAIEDIISVPARQDNIASFRVIADHLRAVCFLIADGVQPANEGRGYVLRRILRRAMRHIHLLGAKDLILNRLAPVLAEQMGEAYPELSRALPLTTQTLLNEEERFRDMLNRGMVLLEKECANLPPGQKLPGAIAFRLYDTYGFPLDLTQDALRLSKRDVDVDGFNEALAAQREQGRHAWKGSGDEALRDVWLGLIEQYGASQFCGYDQDDNDAEILAIVKDGALVSRITAGDEAMLLLDQTCFYAESGGQAGDAGIISAGENLFDIGNTLKQAAMLHVHSGKLKTGSLSKGDRVRAQIDSARRTKIRANHSATHLLHEALRQVLGEHVAQKGSLVTDIHLRFDFSHHQPLTDEEMIQVEALVNAQIRDNQEVITRMMKREQALESGALALFGEKYDDDVRVLFMGARQDENKSKAAYSIEFCGGTHVARLGDIAVFKLVSQTAVGAGMRRIIALTGEAAFCHLRDQTQQLARAAARLKVPPDQLEQRLAAMIDETRQLVHDLRDAKRKLALAPKTSGDQQNHADIETLGMIKFMHRIVKDMDAKDVRAMVDEAKTRLESGIIAMVAINNGKAGMTVGVTPDLCREHNAVELVKIGAHVLGGGGGGGRADMAQAGGPNGAAAQKALDAVRDHLRR